MLQIEYLPQSAGVDLDDYFILRLPAKQAVYLHKLLAKKPQKVKKRFTITLDEQCKTGLLRIKNKLLHGRMVHLPTITDVGKSTNNITIYKTGTISQMFVVEGDKTLEHIKYDNWPHGITQPLKNVRKQRFRKTMRNDEDVKEAARIQAAVTWLLRNDSEAITTRFEICYEKYYEEEDDEEITEEALFGPMSETDSDDSSTSIAHYDIMDFN